MPAHEASVTATFKKAPSGSSGSGNGGSGSQSGNNNSGNKNNNGTTVFISKPGVSNTSLASAQVSGSSDNYVIRISETAAATAAVEKALTNEYGSLDDVRYSAMDISLYDATGTNRITNYSGLSITITMPIPDVMTQYAGNNKVAGVVNEKLDKLKPKFTSIDGVPCVTFTATHFSPYTIYVNTKNLSGEPITIDGSPKTGDGIHPKWFLVAGLLAISIALFFMKDKKPVPKGTLA
jgi:LPXTG-motif cell wall-anchored protein